MKASIVYQDIAVGAAEGASVTATNAFADSAPQKLMAGVPYRNQITAEPCRWMLDGLWGPYNGNIALWTKASNTMALFGVSNPTITVTLDGKYNATGITLIFDDPASELKIAWYEEGAVKKEQTFYPDSFNYVCEYRVESFDKIVIEFIQSSLALHRVKVRQIIIGAERRYEMDELRKVGITNETDVSALSLPVSKLRWTLDAKDTVPYLFQAKQPVLAFSGYDRIGTYYVTEAQRTANRLYEITCEDAIGVLETAPFAGGVYTAKSAVELAQEIVGDYADLLIEADDTTVTGAILPQTRRGALQQLLVAWGAVAATDTPDGAVRIFQPSSGTTHIRLDRTFYGVRIDEDAPITRLELTAHTYTPDADGSIEINGQKYSEVTTVHGINNSRAVGAKENVVQITDATLVNEQNATAVLLRLLEYYQQRASVKTDFVWQGERLGQQITQWTPWGTTVDGKITSMEIKLSNTVVVSAEIVSAGDETGIGGEWRANEIKAGEA